jgi:hypothetical protein
VLGLAAPSLAREPPTVASAGPDAVSVTIYRDPYRGADDEMDLDWLEGFALITETRTIDLPAGETEIRLAGVAGGIVPASAIISGLPGAPGERNLDARLLSPGALVDASLGRRVHVRRTSRATGKVTETEAIVRSGPEGIVLETPAGVEALRCTGLPETLVYAELPKGLSDKPTLAVSASSPVATRATIRLSYLATAFDWQANYVASVRPDGRTLDLFAWLTLANGNDESFSSAQTQVVAGSLNREEDDQEDLESGGPPAEIALNCWSQGTNGEVVQTHDNLNELPQAYAEGSEDIIVTGSRVMRENLLSVTPVTVITAELEELGDHKLYRIPEPVTVSASGQKQVALLRREQVPFVSLYAYSLRARGSIEEPEAAALLIRMKNIAKEGLGLPLPTGRLALFEQSGGRPMLVGETSLEDIAVGRDVEIRTGANANLRLVQRMSPAQRRRSGKAAQDADEEDDDYHGSGTRRYRVEISNASDRPAQVEVELRVYNNETLRRPNRKLATQNGRRVWRVMVPANGRSTLSYDVFMNPSPARRHDSRSYEDEEG